MIQDVWDKCTGNIGPVDISPKYHQTPEQQQPLMDFENGVIVKIYKSKVDPILVGGRLRRPQTKIGISTGPMTLKFLQSPHFQNQDFEKGKKF